MGWNRSGVWGGAGGAGGALVLVAALCAGPAAWGGSASLPAGNQGEADTADPCQAALQAAEKVARLERGQRELPRRIAALVDKKAAAQARYNAAGLALSQATTIEEATAAFAAFEETADSITGLQVKLAEAEKALAALSPKVQQEALSLFRDVKLQKWGEPAVVSVAGSAATVAAQKEVDRIKAEITNLKAQHPMYTDAPGPNLTAAQITELDKGISALNATLLTAKTALANSKTADAKAAEAAAAAKALQDAKDNVANLKSQIAEKKSTVVAGVSYTAARETYQTAVFTFNSYTADRNAAQVEMEVLTGKISAANADLAILPEQLKAAKAALVQKTEACIAATDAVASGGGGVDGVVENQGRVFAVKAEVKSSAASQPVTAKGCLVIKETRRVFRGAAAAKPLEGEGEGKISVPSLHDQEEARAETIQKEEVLRFEETALAFNGEAGAMSSDGLLPLFESKQEKKLRVTTGNQIGISANKRSSTSPGEEELGWQDYPIYTFQVEYLQLDGPSYSVSLAGSVDVSFAQQVPTTFSLQIPVKVTFRQEDAAVDAVEGEIKIVVDTAKRTMIGEFSAGVASGTVNGRLTTAARLLAQIDKRQAGMEKDIASNFMTTWSLFNDKVKAVKNVADTINTSTGEEGHLATSVETVRLKSVNIMGGVTDLTQDLKTYTDASVTWRGTVDTALGKATTGRDAIKQDTEDLLACAAEIKENQAKLQESVDALNGKADAELKRDIFRALAGDHHASAGDHEMVNPLFLTPESAGGHFEKAMDVVTDAIERFEAAGGDSEDAWEQFKKANQILEAGAETGPPDYAKAWDYLKEAVEKAQIRPRRDDDDEGHDDDKDKNKNKNKNKDKDKNNDDD